MRIPWLKIFRVLAFFIAAGALIIILVISWLGYEGHKEWEKTRADLLARGEKLLLTDMIPPEIPPEENFFADPLWEEPFDLIPEETPKGKVFNPRLPMDRQQISQLTRTGNANEIESLKQQFPEFASIMNDANHNFLKIALTCRRNRTNSKQMAKLPAPTPREAEFILALLEPSASTLKRIAELAKRPSGRAPLRYEDGIEKALPHSSYLLEAAQLLSLRAEARLALGDSTGAFTDTLLIFHLAQKIETEPILISLLVCVNMNRIGVEVVKQGIPFWSPSQLEEIEGLLGRIDFVALLARAWRGERGAGNLCFNDFRKNLGFPKVVQDAANHRLGSAAKNYVYRVWLDQDCTFYNRIIQEAITSLELESPNLKPHTPKAIDKKMEEMSNNSWTGAHIFSALLLPAIDSVSAKVAFTQNAARQAMIACALQRWLLANGSLPEKLNALVPDYLPALPPDGVTGAPMHYRRTSDNTYDLWSVGWNETDEGGMPCETRKLQEADWVWNSVRAN